MNTDIFAIRRKVHLFSKEMAFQKLDYTHYNPCTEYWQLAKEPIVYLFSSAKYYEVGIKNFTFIKDLRMNFNNCSYLDLVRADMNQGVDCCN